MEDLVSVIIPVHNTEKYVKRCLNSVLSQTYFNLEVIVVDDCSDDSSLELIKKIEDKRIKIIEINENKGVSYARNQAIDIASGRYLCFLDSDDFWVENKIQKEIEFIKQNNYEFVYSNYAYFTNETTDFSKCKVVKVPKKLTYKQAIKNTTIFISTVMLDLNKVKKEEIYMPDLRIGQDTAAWWNILRNNRIAYGINEVLAYYRVANKSLSSNKLRAIKGAWKIYMREDINMFKRIFYFTCYLINAVKRRI